MHVNVPYARNGITKIKAEPSVDPLTTYSTYNSHHHQHHDHHHVNLPLKSVVIKEETLLLPDQICSTPIDPPFSRQVKPFTKLSPLQPVVENPMYSVIASRVVPSAKSTAAVAATPREKNVIASKDRCKRGRQGNLPKKAVRVMTDWLKSNRYNAYPSEDDILKMVTILNIKQKQVSAWFANARHRKLTQILHKEGKDSKDYRISRKKKNTSLDKVTKIKAEPSVDPLTTYSTYNSHHHQHHDHHHVNLPLKSVAIKEETLLLPDQICSTPFSRQVKPFAKLSLLQPVVENPMNSVIASRVVPSAKSTAAVAATSREKSVIASEDRFTNARRRKLTQILHKEGKDSKDYRITRKKKNTSLDEGRATSSETEVSTTNLSTSSYPSPSSSTSSASDGSLDTGAVVSAKQCRRSENCELK
ncbi:TGIF2-like isoform X2 [Octopus vulgaris]|uniref:TGIF2-like isoform X2 n=1 Tax=Octopus vulgaris TaxID=6645 RepID=A0AA36FFT9_OCTVU|nr:TGIF2-like isoform X2 [Octopus vulgaris]